MTIVNNAGEITERRREDARNGEIAELVDEAFGNRVLTVAIAYFRCREYSKDAVRAPSANSRSWAMEEYKNNKKWLIELCEKQKRRKEKWES